MNRIHHQTPKPSCRRSAAALLCAGLACGPIIAAAAEPGIDDAPASPASIDDYHFVNAFVVTDPENPLFGMHELYVNTAGLDAFRRGGPYPAGAEFLGMVYALDKGEGTLNEGAGQAITLMRKVDGADDTGRWRFAMFGADGEAMDIDPVKDCFECHTQVEQRDYVFSTPRSIGELVTVPGTQTVNGD